MDEGGASRAHKAYCIRCDGDTSVAWSHNESFAGTGYKKLTQKQISIVAGSSTHVLRRDDGDGGGDEDALVVSSGDPKKPRLTSLRSLAVEKTCDSVFRWTKDGLRLEQHVHALQQEITTLKADHARMSSDYSYNLSRYDADRLNDARDRTQAMKDQANLQRDIAATAAKLRQQQVLYRQVLGEKMKTLSLKGLRTTLGGGTKLRGRMEAAMRAALNGRFCDELFRVMWSLENLEEVNFKHLRAPPLEAGLIAWVLNDWRTKVRERRS